MNEPVIKYDMPAAEYHADPCPEPSLSSSVAHTLLKGTALQAWHQHPRLGNGERAEETAAMRTGQLLHALLLGGPEFSVIEAGDWRTKAAKASRDHALQNGQLPILAHVHEDAKAMAELVRLMARERGVLLAEGHSEVTILHQRDVDGQPIWIRARLDHVRADGALYIHDLKTTAQADQRSLWRMVERYGYHIQQAAYTEAAEAAWPEWAGRVVFRFLVVELEPVLDVRVVELDGTMRTVGELHWIAAKERWARCIRTGDWPGYGCAVTRLETPAWYGYQEGVEL